MVATKNPFFENLYAAVLEMDESMNRLRWAELGKGLQAYQERLKAFQTLFQPNPLYIDIDAFQDFIERLDRPHY